MRVNELLTGDGLAWDKAFIDGILAPSDVSQIPKIAVTVSSRQKAGHLREGVIWIWGMFGVDFIDNLLELLDTDRRDHGLLVTWSLWFHRNIRCWKAIDVGAPAIVAFVVQFLQDRKDAQATFMQVQQPPAVNCLRQSAWVKPTQPWVKCNVDGWLFPVVAIWEALSWLRSMGIDHEVVESDCKEAIIAVNTPAEDNSEFGAMIRDYLRLKAEFQDIVLCWVRQCK
ncbi:hypothetical protein Gohar_009196 [Gossypium harknessii]|uniref:RNase H type-1 domain-containing protein n=1 Tax=Gossypium harknessii TaxID=34285 RepID=A0A7J9GM72_9ROSI|nr:hypothetical protein [Gossypium harknessii]